MIIKLSYLHNALSSLFQIRTLMAKTLVSTSIWHQSNAKVPDSFLIEIDPWVCSVWVCDCNMETYLCLTVCIKSKWDVCINIPLKYCQTSNIGHTFVGNKIIDHWRCSWSTACRHCSNYIFILDLMDWAKATARWDKKHLSVEIWCVLY